MKALKNKGHPSGLTLIELVVVLAVFTLFIMFCTSGAVTLKAKSKAQRAACQNNLKQIGLSFRTWEGDHTNLYPMSVSTNDGGSMQWLAGSNMFQHFKVMANELNNPDILHCPSDDRQPAKIFTTLNNNNVSYFVGLDADETTPAMPLAGDRNLVTNGVPVVPGLVAITSRDTVAFSDKMHNHAGNVGLADGSVQQWTSKGLQTGFSKTGISTNRLAVP